MASDTLAKIDRARAAVAELNYGAREWKGLHEPASEDATDVVIMEALRCAALEIARLSRELEAERALIRELVDDEDAGLVWTGTRVVCAYCSATDRYGVEHDRDCLIERARRALAEDTEGDTRAERCRPGQSGGLRAIFGRWPGDETDEEIREWLERES